MSGFEITTSQQGDIHILHISGYLDAHTVPRFEEAIQDLVKKQHYKIIVNMEKLDYISSAGLGVFMGFIEEIREHGGDIKLCRLSDKVFRVFDLLGFPTLFDIVADQEEAVQRFEIA